MSFPAPQHLTTDRQSSPSLGLHLLLELLLLLVYPKLFPHREHAPILKPHLHVLLLAILLFLLVLFVIVGHRAASVLLSFLRFSFIVPTCGKAAILGSILSSSRLSLVRFFSSPLSFSFRRSSFVPCGY